MSRPHVALPIFVQIALLVAVSSALVMAVCFAAVVHAPPPAQPGFTIDQAASALEGQTVRTDEGRTLRRQLSNTSPLPAEAQDDPFVRVISMAIQRHLNLAPDAVRVRLAPPDGPRRHGGLTETERRWTARTDSHSADGQTERRETIIIRSAGADEPPPEISLPLPPPPPDAAGGPRVRVLTEDIRGGEDGSAHQQITVLTEELRFPPFTASVRQPDGRWATVSPPGGIWTPWHTRILLVFLGSLALLLPLAWWTARQLARPIGRFAQAAERLGSDPHAPALDETGPAEIRHAAHAFNEMQAKLNRYVEGRTQMVAAIAHDLRTPLTRLRFRAEQADPDVRDRMAADIAEMDDMISQALSYVRGVSLRETRSRLDLSALVAAVVADLSEVGAEIDLSAEAPIQIEGEPLNLRRAVSNLVENAVKFAGRAEVAVTRDQGRAVVTVSDRGPGLAEAELEAVFEPFRRGEQSRNRDTGGAGLGLAVTRGIARAHGGDVVLLSRDGGGLNARLTLPLAD